MSIRDFMDHFSAKLDDEILLSAPTTSGTYVTGVLQSTPTDSGTLNVRLVDPDTGELGAYVVSGVPPSGQFRGENFWRVVLSQGTYLPRTYYKAEIVYSGTDSGGGDQYHEHYIDDGGDTIHQQTHSGTHTWMIHVNDNYEYIETLKRATGLAGVNVRRTGWSYSKGNVVEFTSNLYRTVTDVQLAESGTSDSPFAQYKVTVTYDHRLNRTKIESIRIL